MLLTPGAGSGRDHPALLAVADAVAPRPCVRLDFPYRRAGRRFPDKAPVLVATIVAAAGELAAAASVPPHRLALGGRSMGGRMCSMAVAEGLPAAGLILVAYPLHPPGRPDRPRTAHLDAIGVPCLFVSGTKDDFATPDELTAATAAISGPVTHVWVRDGRHELRGSEAVVAAVVRAWLDGEDLPDSVARR